MSMYEIYSNLRSCIEDMDRTGSLDAHIALYALEHHDEVPAMSIGELAQACSTSTASISRFCRRVNSSDFRGFKEQLIEYNAWLRSEPAANRARQTVDVPWYFDILETAFYQTRRLLTEPLLNQAVDWLMDAPHVYVYGSSFSNILAREASEKLNRINVSSFSFSSVKGQLASLDLLHERDAVMLISFSGRTRHVLELYRRAVRTGCRIIWVTASDALICEGRPRELVLPVSGESLSEYRTSLIEGMSLRCAIDALYICYTNRLRVGDGVVSHMSR